MTHWIIVPIVLPAMMAAIITLAARQHLSLQRILSLASSLVGLAVALGLAWQAADGTITLYQLGEWRAPFGIVLVGDRLSTLMVLLASLLAPLVLLYAIGSGWDARGRNFHALFQFQMMGILGAFLTGDAFNLFVFFEILLIASYGLMTHSGGGPRLKAGTQYVLYNLLGSTLFLFALGTLYAETGTLNMADLAGRVAAMDPGQTAGIRVAAVLLLLVFAIKAAILPLHFWLPASYSQSPAPIAALFAIMTKVGAYAIIRFYTLIFPPDLPLTQGLFDLWLMPVALLTLAIGMIGVLGARYLDRLIAFAVIGSMGMLMTSVSIFTPEGISAALYYAIHSTFVSAALFLIVDVVRDRRTGVDLRVAPPMAGGALVAALFFVAAIGMAGLPPLSGFLGKLLILDAATGSPMVWWAWATILASSLVAVVGFSRAGSVVFWKSHGLVSSGAEPVTTPEDTRGEREPAYPPAGDATVPTVAIFGLLSMLVAATVFAGPLKRYLDATAAQLFDPAPYVATVMETPGKEITDHHGADHAESDAAMSETHGDPIHEEAH